MAISNVYVGLIHYPVYNKHQEKVTTSITNIDLHDISRLCCCYGVKKFFIINPLQSQHDLYAKILNFWQSDIGKNYQPDRAEAVTKTMFVSSCTEAIDYIKNQENAYPVIITTTAKHKDNQVEYDSLNCLIKDNSPVFISFGTGYGLAEEVHQMADYVLKPIEPNRHYNHLSVRSAAAIVLDRLIPKNK